jgi:hypothetical protein
MARTAKARKATAKAPAPVRHRPVIEQTVSDGCAVAYRLRCTCGEAGQEWGQRAAAGYDKFIHVNKLIADAAIPAGQRCRFPRAHDRREWEPCALCAGQESLFDIGRGV